MRTHAIIGVCAVACLLLIAATFYFGESKKATQAPINPTGDAQALRERTQYWQNKIQELGANEAYAAFKIEAPETPGLTVHSQAHAFGEALYEERGLPGLTVCDTTFDFGCYHSFFGVAVHKEGIGKLPELSASCRAKYTQADENLPCQHGIGHGLLVYTDYDKMLEALELCETISESLMGGCTSGVFMEYNFHTMDESNGEEYFREVEGDLYAPCSTLPSRFQPSCYFEQVQWWQVAFKSDFKYIGELCGIFEENSENFYACYNGIGNYVAAHAHNDIDKIQEMCGLMDTPSKVARCHEGASWLVRSIEGMEEAVGELCRVLSEPYRTECFQKLR